MKIKPLRTWEFKGSLKDVLDFIEQNDEEVIVQRYNIFFSIKLKKVLDKEKYDPKNYK